MNETTIVYNSQKSGYLAKCWSLTQVQDTSNTEGFVPSEAILLGIVTESKNLLLHHLILLARHHIYTCKLKETRPSFEMYKQLVYNTLQIENKIAIVNNSMHVFKKKWSCFKNINF